MTARPKFGDAIAVEGVRPAWLPDDASMEISAGGNWCSAGLPGETWRTDDKQWRFITAIRLEVPRYDFVYLALERGMVPYFGMGRLVDWDGGPVLLSSGTMHEVPPGEFWTRDTDIIGYTRKATSTALPLAHPAADVCASCGFPWGADPVRHSEFCDNRTLAHPAAPQGDGAVQSQANVFAAAMIVASADSEGELLIGEDGDPIYWPNKGGGAYKAWHLRAIADELDKRAALAPAAIASGREGAE